MNFHDFIVQRMQETYASVWREMLSEPAKFKAEEEKLEQKSCSALEEEPTVGLADEASEEEANG
jgi:hypothetical protein